MNADGSGLVQLTENESNDDSADWSPDGTRIAWAHRPSDVEDNIDIWVMNADGGAKTRLTSDGTFPDLQPAWSPDGSKIAFTRRVVAGEAADIFVMNADGSGLVNRTNSPDLEDADAAWSPDGSKIAFARSSVFNINWEIYVMNADGSGLVQLTDNPSFDGYPAWSPDGQRIAFTTDRANSPYYGDVFVMNADGSGLVNLTNSPGVDDGNASWSPDGTRIAFMTWPLNSFEIYTMNADGTDPVNLTLNDADDYRPDWQRLETPPPQTAQRAGDRDSRRPEWRLRHAVHDAPVLPDRLQHWQDRQNTSARDRSDACLRRSGPSSALARCAPASPAGLAPVKSARRGHNAPDRFAPHRGWL